MGNKIDPQSRYVLLKGSIAGKLYTFATIYAPNTNQLTFIDTPLELLVEFKEGFLVLGGDFNVSPTPYLTHPIPDPHALMPSSSTFARPFSHTS